MAAVSRPGQRNLITDVAGLRVGNAQDQVIKTGTTVLLADAAFRASVHVMGGAPGTRETDLLAPDKTVDAVDALVLSGGSAFGLDACGGVMDALRAQGRGFAVGPARVPIVPGAILFDLINGGDKTWSENPYPALGKAAVADANADFALGSVGAGTGALSGTHKGGLGSASLVLPDGTTVGALVAVNAIGATTTPDGKHFWAAPYEVGAEFGGFGPDLATGFVGPFVSAKEQAIGLAAQEQANTTIAIVATDAALTKSQCHRLAVMAHDGMGRAIVPAHTPLDGDLVFALSTTPTGETDHGTFAQVGSAAAVCLTRAIARAIYHATPAKGDLLPCFRLA